MGKEYEQAFHDTENPGGSGNLNKKIGQKAGGKRYSAREKKPVTIDDLGYVDKDQGKKGGKSSYTNSEGYRKCERILGQLKKHQHADKFMNAVSNIPGKEHMDLMTVEKKLKAGLYPSSYHFALDVRKIWTNSWESNEKESEIFEETKDISNAFEKLMKEVGDVKIIPEENSEIQQLKKKVSKVTGQLKRMSGPVKNYSSGTPRGSGTEKPMTLQEKSILKQSIMKLPPDKLPGVIQIIKDAIDMTQSQDMLEFDIDELPPKKCRELEQYVRKNMGSGQKTSKKKKFAAKVNITKLLKII